MHHDPHSSTRVLIYIHHLPYQNSTSRYLDCRHNNSGHPQTTCTSTPDSTTFTPHLHFFFFYFSSSSHPSSPQTPSQSPPLSRENRLYTSIPFSQVHASKHERKNLTKMCLMRCNRHYHLTHGHRRFICRRSRMMNPPPSISIFS